MKAYISIVLSKILLRKKSNPLSAYRQSITYNLKSYAQQM